MRCQGAPAYWAVPSFLENGTPPVGFSVRPREKASVLRQYWLPLQPGGRRPIGAARAHGQQIGSDRPNDGGALPRASVGDLISTEQRWQPGRGVCYRVNVCWFSSMIRSCQRSRQPQAFEASSKLLISRSRSTCDSLRGRASSR